MIFCTNIEKESIRTNSYSLKTLEYYSYTVVYAEGLVVRFIDFVGFRLTVEYVSPIEEYILSESVSALSTSDSSFSFCSRSVCHLCHINQQLPAIITIRIRMTIINCDLSLSFASFFFAARSANNSSYVSLMTPEYKLS